jgi:OOP family OmpA-OmpF porin
MSQEPAANRRTVSGDLAQLRGLLVGPEQAAIEELRERLDNSRLFTESVGAVLAEAIRLRADRDPALRNSLDRIVEDAIVLSVRRNPSILTEALFPIIGAAVRRAVAAALRGMMQSIDQMFEQGLSLRALQWRWEALRTGRSFGQIVVTRSSLYRVEQVFLIHRKAGLLLLQRAAEGTVIKDADLIAAMMTAIQDFVSDSFGGPPGQDLETFQVGECTVWIQHGPQAILAAVVRGVAPSRLRMVFERALETICSEQCRELAEFDGDAACFEKSAQHLDSCLLGRLPPGRRRRGLLPWAMTGVVILLLGTWGVLTLFERGRWNDYVDRLGREPGIVVTETGKRGGTYFVSGLRDPLAADPAALLSGSGVEAAKVRFQWEPYLSLEAPLQAARQLGASKLAIERSAVRFSAGSARISAAQHEMIFSLAPEFRRLSDAAAVMQRPVRVGIVGHTDASGSESRNQLLAEQRAAAVLSALTQTGVRRSQLEARGAGTSEPLRHQDPDLEKELNRSVTLHVLMPQ